MTRSAIKRERQPQRRSPFNAKSKTTISLSRRLLEYADERAAARQITRSQLIEDLLAEAQQREEEELMVEGYRFFNDENVAFAAQAVPAVWGAIKNDR